MSYPHEQCVCVCGFFGSGFLQAYCLTWPSAVSPAWKPFKNNLAYVTDINFYSVTTPSTFSASGMPGTDRKMLLSIESLL